MLADTQAALFNSYIQGKFDPDRPYIQMVVPKTDEDAYEEKKIPGHPLVGPTPPPPETPTEPETEKPTVVGNGDEACVNESVNGTNTTTLNETLCQNETRKNSTGKTHTVFPVQALLMLADGTTLYSVGNKQNQESAPLLDGAYELAYVAHQPNLAPLSSNPYVQFANYDPLYWGNFYGRIPFVGNPYNPGYAYEPVYIYKPIYPSASHSYDVYYYLPVDKETVEHQSKPKAKEDTTLASTKSRKQDPPIDTVELASQPNSDTQKASELTMPNAVTEDAIKVQPVTEEEIGLKEQPVTEEEIDLKEQPVTEEEIGLKEQPVTEDEIGLKEQALVNTLISQIETEEQENGQSPSEEEEMIEEEETKEVAIQKLDTLEEELDRLSDEDLISAVEEVLQQLHSRLID